MNDYLREVSEQDFTAKDFRTWAGSVLAYTMLGKLEPFDSASQAKKNLVQMIKDVAERLGNTPSVCRKCYVHPVLLDCYLAGTMANILKRNGKRPTQHSAAPPHALDEQELGLMHLLERTLKAAENSRK